MTLTRLDHGSVTAPYDVENTGVGIVHIGPGAFHRAHQAVFTEDALAHGGDWRVCGVQMRSSGVRDALRPQNFRYTLAILDETSSTRVISSMADILVASEDVLAVINQIAAPSTHILSLTVTEKGYCLTPAGKLDLERPEVVADLANPAEPQTAIGLIVAALTQRRERHIMGLTIISCDNLSDNGRLLETAVHQFAEQLDPSLKAWIGANVAFPCTMVDSITPATDDALRQLVHEKTGYVDAMPVSREAFSQWVIEDKFSGPRPAWGKVGVTFTDNVALFETAKIRLLNGAHSALAYVGMLRGHHTVRAATSDDTLYAFVRELMLEEVCPTLQASDELDLVAYTDQILLRFRNPEIEYRLAQIAWDGSQKVRFRFFATIADNLAANRPTERLIYAVAAWLHFVRRCQRDGVEMTDPMREPLLLIASRCTGDGVHDVQCFLELPDLFVAPLKGSAAFADQLANAYTRISKKILVRTIF
ncbi:MAG: mannitol dehydrogenase family protein [Gammaproteobacteria bacterium]